MSTSIMSKHGTKTIHFQKKKNVLNISLAACLTFCMLLAYVHIPLQKVVSWSIPSLTLHI